MILGLALYRQADEAGRGPERPEIDGFHRAFDPQVLVLDGPVQSECTGTTGDSPARHRGNASAVFGLIAD